MNDLIFCTVRYNFNIVNWGYLVSWTHKKKIKSVLVLLCWEYWPNSIIRGESSQLSRPKTDFKPFFRESKFYSTLWYSKITFDVSYCERKILIHKKNTNVPMRNNFIRIVFFYSSFFSHQPYIYLKLVLN